MDYRVLLRVDRTAKLISFSSGDLKVFTDTYSEVDTVFSSSWSADIAGRNNLVILNYYRSEISSETGASFKNSLSDIKIVIDFVCTHRLTPLLILLQVYTKFRPISIIEKNYSFFLSARRFTTLKIAVINPVSIIAAHPSSPFIPILSRRQEAGDSGSI